MKNLSKFNETARFSVALCFLCTGLMFLATTYIKWENNVLAKIWGIPLNVLLALSFGLGWWLEYFFEYSLLSKKLKSMALSGFILLSLFCLICFGGMLVLPDFLGLASSASGLFLVSGFSFRLTNAKLDSLSIS